MVLDILYIFHITNCRMTLSWYCEPLQVSPRCPFQRIWFCIIMLVLYCHRLCLWWKTFQFYFAIFSCDADSINLWWWNGRQNISTEINFIHKIWKLCFWFFQKNINLFRRLLSGTYVWSICTGIKIILPCGWYYTFFLLRSKSSIGFTFSANSLLFA